MVSEKRIVHAPHFGMFRQKFRDPLRVRILPRHAHSQRLQPANEHPRGVRVHAVAQGRTWLPATTPQIRSVCPARYFVPECMIKSMPKCAGCWLIGVPNVASIMLSNLCCLAIAATFLKSTTRNVGLVGDSR